jgi:hypothetical protein
MIVRLKPVNSSVPVMEDPMVDYDKLRDGRDLIHNGKYFKVCRFRKGKDFVLIDFDNKQHMYLARNPY